MLSVSDAAPLTPRHPTGILVIMRILVASLGSPGHTYPVIPLAQALRDVGHELTVAVGAEVHGAVRAAGLDVVVAGMGMREAFARAWTDGAPGAGGPPAPAQLPLLVGEVFGGVMPRAVAADLIGWIDEHRPDLVIAEVGNAGAALAARHTGTPCVVHSFGRRPDTEGETGVRIAERLAEVAAELGLEAPADPSVGNVYLDICPPSLQGRPTDRAWPLRPVAWSPPTPFTDRRRDSTRPWVYLTLGTAMGEARILRGAVEGLARLDVDVLVAAGSVAVHELVDLAALDDRVQVEAFVPQAALMDRFALAVHHGGSGTTLGAAAAGVPQLLIPQGADQPGNAAAVTAVGAGATLGADVEIADAVAGAAARLLDDPGVRDATAALAAEVAAMPTPAEVAARVEGWGRP